MDSPPQAEGDSDEEFVTVATFDNAFEAATARGALEAAGILAIAPDDYIGSFSGLGPRGFAELKVRTEDRDRAASLLKKLGHR